MTPHLFDALPILADYLSWQQRFAGIEGFLHDLEGYILLQLAARGGGVGAIVEIGSFMGRSTTFLAAGAKLSGRERVVAVDHFRGSPATTNRKRNCRRSSLALKRNRKNSTPN